MVQEIILASNNSGKVAEVLAALGPLGYVVVPMADIPSLATFDIAETGETFAQNAELKARICFEKTGQAALGDDSGLLVNAFGEWPGVQSHRWHAGSDTDRNAALLAKMADQSNRACAFQTVLCLVDISGAAHFFTGRLEGNLAAEMRGQAGFGYDSIFIPVGETKTLAELGMAYKNKVSHRAQALQELQHYLESHPQLKNQSQNKVEK